MKSFSHMMIKQAIVTLRAEENGSFRIEVNDLAGGIIEHIVIEVQKLERLILR